MKRYGPAVLVATVLLVAVAAGGWGRHRPTIPEGRFTVEAENITEGADLFVKRLNIVANGAKGIRLTEGESGSSWMSLTHTPLSDDGMQHVQLVFVVDKSQDLGTDHCSILWLQQITNEHGARVGGPSRYPMPSNVKIEDFVEIALPEGEYAIGETLLLGMVDGQPIEFTVEKHERAPERE